ncbi:hypothetical protein M8J77_021331 [Diaphorina citri]|nr:hypothetical protein M8J77_021331 [Diaphorina citri]
MEQLKSDLQNVVMKGKFPKSLYNDPNVHKNLSKSYLTDGYLMPETEGFIHAIQDQVMKTRNNIRHIMKVQIDSDLCRLCNQITESIQHLSGGCSILALKEYTNRHNLVGNIIHQELLKKASSSNKTCIPHYLYTPAPVIENENIKICWDISMQTETNIINNRPDIVYVDKTTNSISIIDITIPLDDNINTAYSNKIAKYEDLRRQLKNIYNRVVQPLRTRGPQETKVESWRAAKLKIQLTGGAFYTGFCGLSRAAEMNSRAACGPWAAGWTTLIYNINNVFIFPIVITTNGLVHKNTFSNLEKNKIKNARNVVKKCQKSVIISTTGIIRRVLAEEE